MLRIEARNDDGERLLFQFKGAEGFLYDMEHNDGCMADHEILLVELDGRVVYSSLYVRAKTYGETLRTMDLYEWFK